MNDLIISHKHKLIFVTTPKSGSHTGFKLMKDYYEAEAAFNHGTSIPDKCRNYHSFTFVRNPYERFCSLFNACVVNPGHNKRYIPLQARMSILHYAKWLAKLTQTRSYPRIDLCAAQEVWHEKTNVKEYVQIEKAQDRFAALDVPHELKRGTLTWKDVRTDNILHYVNIWAGKDFDLYGYTKE